MAKGSLDVDLLGASFTIQANESDEYLESIYSYYKNMVEQVKNVVGESDPLKIAIIAGILITDELKKEKITFENLSDDDRENVDVVKSANRIIEKLDSAINDEDMD